MFLPCKRWEPADHGHGGAVWSLCLFPSHSKPRVANLYRGYWTWMWSSSSGGIDRHHGMLCLWADLQDCWKSGWRDTVSGRAADWIWLRFVSSGLEQRGGSTSVRKSLGTVWVGHVQNWMGLLLHRWRSGCRNAYLHMVVMFLRKEAKAISILEATQKIRISFLFSEPSFGARLLGQLTS